MGGKYPTTGYGAIKRNGKRLLAHRVSFEEFNGPIPDGFLVRHTCDVRECVNPEHLLIGTHADNHRDKAVRCRGRKSRLGRPFGAALVHGRWQAVVGKFGKRSYLGYFDTAEEASRAALEFKMAV